MFFLYHSCLRKYCKKKIKTEYSAEFLKVEKKELKKKPGVCPREYNMKILTTLYY